ncbi:MAG: hypothetical protein JRI62_09075 [Deltaproteobacteria bacterium]|nr:hypothetical protein [Deltaproteobacteria bacterium]
MKKNNHSEAEKVYEQIIVSYAGQKSREDWQPETCLLISLLMYGYGSADDTVIKLLQDWIQVADKLNKTHTIGMQLQRYFRRSTIILSQVRQQNLSASGSNLF